MQKKDDFGAFGIGARGEWGGKDGGKKRKGRGKDVGSNGDGTPRSR